MKKQIINLNHGCIFIDSFGFGTTEFRVKAGRKFYNAKIEKNALGAMLCVWQGKPGKTMYNGTLTFHAVKDNAILRRDFFERRADIEKAQRIARIYRNTLEM